MNFQAKAVAKFLDEDVFMPSEVVTDLGRTVDMNDGTLTVRYDCSSINDPKLRDAWKRGAEAAHLEFNSHAKKEERLQKEKIMKDKQVAAEAAENCKRSQMAAEATAAYKQTINRTKMRSILVGSFILFLFASSLLFLPSFAANHPVYFVLGSFLLEIFLFAALSENHFEHKLACWSPIFWPFAFFFICYRAWF